MKYIRLSVSQTLDWWLQYQHVYNDDYSACDEDADHDDG